MDYLQKIRLLYNLSDNKNFGIKNNVLVSVENNLGIKLPKILYDYYLQFGNNKKINKLLPPSEIKYSGDGEYLIFREWDDKFVVSAFHKNDLNKENPKVFSKFYPDNLTIGWHMVSETMDSFLLSMAYEKGLTNGLEFSAGYYIYDGKIEISIIETIKKNFIEIKGILYENTQYFTDKDIGIIELTVDPNGYSSIIIGTNNEETFKNMLNKINVKWEWGTGIE